jgi:hypothetical protein
MELDFYTGAPAGNEMEFAGNPEEMPKPETCEDPNILSIKSN